MRHASRYSIGATPTSRWKRSKNVERDSAASLASSATVHDCAGRSCMTRIASARRLSARPRTRPGGAFVPAADRSASISSTSSRRDRTTSRAGRVSRVSSRTSWTSVASRRSPRTWTNCGNRDTRSDASGEPKLQWPATMRRSTTPPAGPMRNSPWPSGTGAAVRSPAGGSSRLVIVTFQAAGISAKSPACSSSGSRPSTAMRQPPSSTTQ